MRKELRAAHELLERSGEPRNLFVVCDTMPDTSLVEH
eukprot:SAG31_NODE_9873_length_1218_cov_1.243074_1_plen_36_part_10